MTLDQYSPSPGSRIGRAARWLRDKWVFTVATSVAACVALVVPLVLVNTEGQLGPKTKLALILAGSVAILATALDKVADGYDKREAERAQRAELSAVTNSLTALIGLLDSAHDIAFKEGAARISALEGLRIPLIQSAFASPTAVDVRATYYPLTHDKNGLRELCGPKSRGRVDEASTEFFERDDPDHPIWALMSSKDTNCPIHRAPDTGPRVDWPTKPYKAFISVPVQVDGVVFGMLSVNAPQRGDLVEVDRLAVITMARVMALTLAMDTGPRNLRQMRDPSATVDPTQGGDEDV